MKVPHGTTHALPKHSCHVSFFWCQGTKYLGFWHSAGGGKRSTFSAFLKLRHQFIHLILESVTFVEHENICISASWSYWRWLNQRWKTCADFCNQESPTSFALALHPIQKCIVEPPCRPWCFHSYCGDWLERSWKQQYQQFSKLWHQNSVLSRPLCRGCRIAVVFLTWGLRMSEHAEDSPQKRWGHQHRRMRPWAKAKPSDDDDVVPKDYMLSLSMISDFSRSEHLRFPWLWLTPWLHGCIQGACRLRMTQAMEQTLCDHGLTRFNCRIFHPFSREMQNKAMA